MNSFEAGKRDSRGLEGLGEFGLEAGRDNSTMVASIAAAFSTSSASTFGLEETFDLEPDRSKRALCNSSISLGSDQGFTDAPSFAANSAPDAREARPQPFDNQGGVMRHCLVVRLCSVARLCQLALKVGRDAPEPGKLAIGEAAKLAVDLDETPARRLQTGGAIAAEERN